MNPYRTMANQAFWRSAVSEKSPFAIGPLWTPRFALAKQDRIVTAGSCFAQHIGRALAENGYAWHDAEPPPVGMNDENARKLGYGVFSFRTGNIYTTSLLLQWVQWALGKVPPPDEIWPAEERFYDPFRPVVEPNGFGSANELRVSRRGTIQAVRRAIEDANVFVFTLGLTESWLDRETGIHYPMCPGTAAGTFDPARHVFRNLAYPEIHRDLVASIALMRSINPTLRVLLTVSPVPLTATASGQHVLVATTYSKSTLRAVAGDVCAELPDVDYFPSYEIITGTPYRGFFFEPNMRSVARGGVDFVMNSFFSCLAGQAPGAVQAPVASEPRSVPPKPKLPPVAKPDDIACEEELLAAFGESR